MLKRLSLMLLGVTVVNFANAAVPAKKPVFDTPAKQVMLVDADTGAELLIKNVDQRMAPSSMTKILTAYIVVDMIKQGRLTTKQLFNVSKNAFRFDGSTMFLNLNQQISVDELLNGLIVLSGNDAAVALAEGVSGSEHAFAAVMNNYAQKLGMKNSNFINASGYPVPKHYSTARDIIELSKKVIKDQPNYYHLYGKESYSFNGVKQQNKNPLLHRGNSNCDGIKTGYSESGGYGIAASTKNDSGRRLIAVVNGLKSKQARATAVAALLAWGEQTFENTTIYKRGADVAHIPVVAGDKDTVIAKIHQNAIVTTLRGQSNKIKVSVLPIDLQTPFKEGTFVGELQVEIPSGDIYKFPLYAAHNVNEANIFVRGWHVVKKKFG